MHVDIIVGSTLGATEYVADDLSEALSDLGIPNEIHIKPTINAMQANAFWLICTSTHGAGDLPDNIQPFAKQLKSANLAHTSFAILGIGDSSYDTFCKGAVTLESEMTKQGATLITPIKKIDILEYPIPEEEAKAWLATWVSEKLC
jgi:MioC protein